MKSKLELIQEAQSILSSLFEVEDNADTSTNKLRREKKGKNGEEVIVTSVQDELFPYEGNAKEQFNKKVIATINDMIEGKATLEDLIQLVRKGPRRTAHESLSEEIISEVSKQFMQKRLVNAMKHLEDLNKKVEDAKTPAEKDEAEKKATIFRHKNDVVSSHAEDYEIEKIKKAERDTKERKRLNEKRKSN